LTSLPQHHMFSEMRYDLLPRSHSNPNLAESSSNKPLTIEKR
jgi:hypothetical protein